MKIATLLLLANLCVYADDTTVLFQSSWTVGPFPTDSLTVANSAQQTGRQVNLPIPANCGNPTLSACTNNALLNQLDGFSLNPMIVVCFSAAINPATLAPGIQLYPLSSFGPSIDINQILFDPSSNCMLAKPVQVLAAQSRYLLTVTDSVLDTKGQATKASKDFKTCMKATTGYCASLALSANLVSLLAGLGNHLVAASVFTTMSATNWLDKAEAFVNAPTTPVAQLPAGNPSVFSLSSLTSMTWIPQDDNPTPSPQPIPLSALTGVDTVAFGLFLAPNFLNISGPLAGSITVTPTGGPISPPVPIPGLAGIQSGYEPVSFHVFLPPAAKMPPGGFPVVIYGHGLGDNQFGASTFMASTLASNGFATLAIEIPGHGYGAGSIVELGLQGGGTSIVSTPGQGVELAPGAPIGPTDGCILLGPLAIRDCGRQAAVELFAMVRTLQATGGLGLGINSSRIYYVGQSFGSIYGTLFHAEEPATRAAVLNVGGGTSVAVSRLAITARPLAILYLGGNIPPLLNVPPAPPEAYFHDSFNDNYVYRNSPPVTNTIPGVVPIWYAFETAEWLDMNGDPLAFASRLKSSLLGVIPTKSTLIQFALGDLEVPDPTNSALIRAGGLQSTPGTSASIAQRRYIRSCCLSPCRAAPSPSCPIRT